MKPLWSDGKDEYMDGIEAIPRDSLLYNLFEDIRCLQEEIERLEAQPVAHSVKDKLPDNGQTILGINIYLPVTKALDYFDQKSWIENWDASEPVGHMTHWISMSELHRIK